MYISHQGLKDILVTPKKKQKDRIIHVLPPSARTPYGTIHINRHPIPHPTYLTLLHTPCMTLPGFTPSFPQWSCHLLEPVMFHTQLSADGGIYVLKSDQHQKQSVSSNNQTNLKLCKVWMHVYLYSFLFFFKLSIDPRENLPRFWHQ